MTQYKVNRSSFPDKSNTKEATKKKKLPARFNIRIKQDDLAIIDAIADQNQESRSSLLNSLVYSILLDELHSIEDMDSRVLLATSADKLFYEDPLSTPWLLDVFRADLNDMKTQYLVYGELSTGIENHSETFEPFLNRINAISK